MKIEYEDYKEYLDDRSALLTPYFERLAKRENLEKLRKEKAKALEKEKGDLEKWIKES